VRRAIDVHEGEKIDEDALKAPSGTPSPTSAPLG
jgi:hypothetical protein